MAALGAPLTRRECDGCLQDLALVLPRAGLQPGEVDRMLDLYFGLLHEAGVTKAMLQDAAKTYVMAPTKGKPRFFPDPGQLAELCHDQAKARRAALGALQTALGVLDAAAPRPPAEAPAFDARARLHELSEKMKAPVSGERLEQESQTTVPTFSTARPNTDAEELKNHINKKIAH